MKTQQFLELRLKADEEITESLLRDIEHYNGVMEMQSAGAPLPNPWT